MQSPIIRLQSMFGLVIFLAFGLFHAPTVYAQEKVFSRGGTAISGYDPVAYFKEFRPVLGAQNMTYEWHGATWRFSSQANRDAFAQNPERYAPQYGGYCAYAASKGSLAPSDADAWTVHNGKLYLNFSLQVRQLWLRDVNRNIAKANANWPRLNR